MTQRIVVLGAGYAGVMAVQKLEANLDDEYDIVLISDTPFHFALHDSYKIITNPSYRKKITVGIDEIVDDVKFVKGRVEEISPEAERVALSDGRQVTYDKLLVGIGTRTATHNIRGVGENAFSFKSRKDAIKVAEQVREIILDSTFDDPGRIVIAGGGLTGIQIAGEIARLRDEKGGKSISVHLIEKEKVIYPNGPVEAKRKILELLRSLDIELYTSATIEEVTGEQVHTERGNLSYDMLIWTTGITGPEELERSKGIDTEQGRLKVNRKLRVPDYPDIYGCGDVVYLSDNRYPNSQTAIQTGAHAAGNLIRETKGKQLNEWKYQDRGTLVRVGDDVVAHDIPLVPMDAFGGPIAKTLKKGKTEAWLKSLTARKSYYDLLPDKMTIQDKTPFNF